MKREVLASIDNEGMHLKPTIDLHLSCSVRREQASLHRTRWKSRMAVDYPRFATLGRHRRFSLRGY